MKATTLVITRGPNPAYNMSAARDAIRSGRQYDTPSEIEYPAGTLVDHPECWIHCVRSPPVMAPADDECREKVHRWLNHKSRKAMLAKFKHLASKPVYEKCPRWLQLYIDSVNQKWGREMHDVPPDATATADDIKQAIEHMGGAVPEDAQTDSMTFESEAESDAENQDR